MKQLYPYQKFQNQIKEGYGKHSQISVAELPINKILLSIFTRFQFLFSINVLKIILFESSSLDKNRIYVASLHLIVSFSIILMFKLFSQYYAFLKGAQHLVFIYIINQCQDPVTAYLVDFALKKELMGQVEDIVEQFVLQNYYQLIQPYCQINLIKNEIRQKSFLSLYQGFPKLWCNFVKVAGCGGETNCGNFPATDEYFLNYKQIQNYVFDISEKGIQLFDPRIVDYLAHEIPKRKKELKQRKKHYKKNRQSKR